LVNLLSLDPTSDFSSRFNSQTMHHSRRKSGHGLPNTSSTDVRKAAVTATESSKYKRPVMTRKQTPQKLGRSQREREREKTESWEDERESFPQFW
jgi:hypothetical protein